MARGKAISIPTTTSESDAEKKSNMSLFDHLQAIHEKGLYHDLGLLVLSHDDRATSIITPQQKSQLLVYEAERQFNNREYKKAESTYKKALQCRKSKDKGKPSQCPKEFTSEVDIKYQIHLCHVELSQQTQATGVLESIPGRQRTSRVNMALAKLYHSSGMERCAVSHYKEVLRECPLLLSAAVGMLQLGVKCSEVVSIMMSGTSNIPNLDWLWTWLRAQADLHDQKYKECITSLKQLEDKGSLRDCVPLLVTVGTAHYLNGEYKAALPAFNRSRMLEPLNLDGMSLFADILVKEGRARELENLASDLMSFNVTRPEPWLVMAHNCKLNRKLSRALFFAHRSNMCCRFNTDTVNGLILKGYVLLEMKRPGDAVLHFRDALELNPLRYESHRGLVESYLATNRNREAMSVADVACKRLNRSPRALMLCAMAFRTDRLTNLRAKALLEKILQQDPSFVEAVIMLAEMLVQSQDLDGAIKLVKKTVEDVSCPKLYHLLGDLYVKANSHDLARKHYNIAYNLNPNTTRGLEGMRILCQTNESLDCVIDVEIAGESEQESDMRDADTEGLWSEMDVVL